VLNKVETVSFSINCILLTLFLSHGHVLASVGAINWSIDCSVVFIPAVFSKLCYCRSLDLMNVLLSTVLYWTFIVDIFRQFDLFREAFRMAAVCLAVALAACHAFSPFAAAIWCLSQVMLS